MAKQTINVGTVQNDGTGSTIRAGGQIINANFSEIYTAIGDGTTLNIDTSGATANQVLKYDTITSKFIPGTGSAVSFTLAGSAGSAQTLSDGDTITIAAGTGITTTAGATDTVTVAISSDVVTLNANQTLTTKTISGSNNTISNIGNSSLTNSSITLVDDTSSSTTISLGESLKLSGDTGITTTISGDTINIDLDDTTVTPNTYGSSTAVPVLTIDQQGRITSATTSSISSDLTIVDDTSTSATITLGSDTLKIVGSGGLTTSITGDTLTLTQTAATLTYASGSQTGDGSTINFSINSGRTVEDVIIYVNGFSLTPTTDYTISETTLSFTTAPAASAEISIRYLAVPGTYSHADYVGDGSTTTFTINSGRSEDNIIVIVNGLTLVPTTDYTISGTTLNFQVAPAASAETTVRYLRLS
jgi:hypothetical protein